VRGSNYPERWLEIPLRTSLITTRSSGEVTTGSSAQCSVSERVGRFAFPRRRAFSTVNIYTDEASQSSARGGQATTLPSGNESKSKSSPIVSASANGPNGKVAVPVPKTAQTNGARR